MAVVGKKGGNLPPLSLMEVTQSSQPQPLVAIQSFQQEISSSFRLSQGPRRIHPPTHTLRPELPALGAGCGWWQGHYGWLHIQAGADLMPPKAISSFGLKMSE